MDGNSHSADRESYANNHVMLCIGLEVLATNPGALHDSSSMVPPLSNCYAAVLATVMMFPVTAIPMMAPAIMTVMPRSIFDNDVGARTEVSRLGGGRNAAARVVWPRWAQIP
jgi:hypothetical protein